MWWVRWRMFHQSLHDVQELQCDGTAISSWNATRQVGTNGCAVAEVQKRMIGRGFRMCFGSKQNKMAMKWRTNFDVVRNDSVDSVTSTTLHRVCGKRRTCEES